MNTIVNHQLQSQSSRRAAGYPVLLDQALAPELRVALDLETGEPQPLDRRAQAYSL